MGVVARGGIEPPTRGFSGAYSVAGQRHSLFAWCRGLQCLGSFSSNFMAANCSGALPIFRRKGSQRGSSCKFLNQIDVDTLTKPLSRTFTARSSHSNARSRSSRRAKVTAMTYAQWLCFAISSANAASDSGLLPITKWVEESPESLYASWDSLWYALRAPS